MTSQSSHDYSAVLVVPSARELSVRLPLALVGIALIGLSIALSVRADLGVAPWDVLHKGLAERTGASFGLVVVLVGAVVMLAWIPLHQRPGIASVVNVLLVGPSAGVALHWIGAPTAWWARTALLLAALLGFGVGGGLYIGAALGPGPRDGLMTAISARGVPVWKVRTVLEATVLVVGWLLGGPVGVGTIVLAFGAGPITHVALARFHRPITTEAHGE